jgi:hypothetical protein
VEVRHPHEFTLFVVVSQRAENDLVPVETRMALSPIVDSLRRLDVACGGPALLVPRLDIADDQVGRELVDKQQRGEPREQRDPIVERVDVMEHACGDDRVPGLRCEDLRDLLKLASQITVAVRSARVDAHDVVATLGEVLNETSLVAAAHLEHTCRRGR